MCSNEATARDLVARGAFRQAVTVYVRNDTGVDLPRFGVVGLGDPIFTPDVDETEFLRRVLLKGMLIDHEATYDLKWGLTIAPIAAGEIGVAVVQGLCFAMVDDATATTVQPKDGSVSTLTKADCGLARLIWRAAGTGAQWAIICLG